MRADAGRAGAGRAGAGRAEAGRYCTRCGDPAPAGHPECVARARWEPPRFCVHCGRRMVVQVTPTGWSAACSRHGRVGSDGGAAHGGAPGVGDVT